MRPKNPTQLFFFFISFCLFVLYLNIYSHLDLNIAPTINLPSTIEVAETAVGGTVIKTLTVSDGDGDPVDVSCSVTPVDEAYKFVHETDSAYYAQALRFCVC